MNAINLEPNYIRNPSNYLTLLLKFALDRNEDWNTVYKQYIAPPCV